MGFEEFSCVTPLKQKENTHPHNDLKTAMTRKVNHYFWRLVICVCVCINTYIYIYIYTHRYIYIHVLYQMKHWILSLDGMFHALQKSTPQVAASSKPFQLPDRESCMAFHLLHSVSSQTFLVEEMIIMIQMNLNSDGSKQYFTCHHTSTLMILANSRMSMMLLLVFGIMGVASQS